MSSIESRRGALRWFRTLVRGETPGVGEFYQTLWIARHSKEDAVMEASRALADAGDRLLEVESCEAVDDSVPTHTDVFAMGRSYFDAE